jgi:hypothetical protein
LTALRLDRAKAGCDATTTARITITEPGSGVRRILNVDIDGGAATATHFRGFEPAFASEFDSTAPLFSEAVRAV